MLSYAVWKPGLVQSPVPTKVIGTRKDGIVYQERRAVRVLAITPDDRVVIVKASRDNYYKLPGGGVEEGEDHRVAAEREVLEETGAQVSVHTACCTTVEEYRNDLHQISYCYRATLLDEGDSSSAPELTEDEVADGLSHEWVSVGKELEIMATVEPTSELGRYI
ncbi:NUDIX domain-protein [Podospora australis]|uniref:NUDIX domain-protein n=1 Tax=Podospora australis TaxID=1536484 RepID=A0AAN6WPZ0_9PEZI|nr:NUDIX domain-protein [Podospora australis]